MDKKPKQYENLHIKPDLHDEIRIEAASGKPRRKMHELAARAWRFYYPFRSLSDDNLHTLTLLAENPEELQDVLDLVNTTLKPSNTLRVIEK